MIVLAYKEVREPLKKFGGGALSKGQRVISTNNSKLNVFRGLGDHILEYSLQEDFNKLPKLPSSKALKRNRRRENVKAKRNEAREYNRQMDLIGKLRTKHTKP